MTTQQMSIHVKNYIDRHDMICYIHIIKTGASRDIRGGDTKMTKVTKHVVKLVCNDGGLLRMYYADTAAEAEAHRAESAAQSGCTYVIEVETIDVDPADPWQSLGGA